ncbi:hypothetical protein V8D89_013130 [Ganoderma adspersum]
MTQKPEKRTNPYANDKMLYKNFKGGYVSSEYFWRDHQPWLLEQGYMLRRRYRPDWKRSWEGTKKYYEDFEDGLIPMRFEVMDATRISDGRVVVLKKVNKDTHPYEAEIGQLFSTEPLASDPRNRCVPIYDVLQSPLDKSKVLLVMPYLMRHHEGLEFIHGQRVAHRDVMAFNVMMDPTPLYSDIPHPIDRRRNYDFGRRVCRFARTERPAKYYYIDFGISRRYGPDDASPLEDIIVGGDKSVPEFKGPDEPQNPFWTDIYYLGNLIRTNFLEGAHGFEFMRSLIDDMVQRDPAKRPTIGQARSRFEELRGSLSERKLRPHPLDATVFDGGLFRDEYFWRDHQPWLAQSGYMLRPRYRHDWEPSWLKTGEKFYFCEDGMAPLITTIMDAVRTSDGRIVALKQVPKSRYPDEEELNRFLTMSEPQASDRHNHSVPVYEVLQSPLDNNVLFLVMPYLVDIDRVKFATVGEAMECFRQLFEGLQFLHHHHIAHCDIKKQNIMMDPTILSDIPHPARYSKSINFKRYVRTRTRTSHPTRYFYIDFGLSFILPPDDPSPRVLVSRPGDKSVPEFKDPGPHGRYSDPYKIDIYCLGNTIRENFMAKSPTFEFLRPVVAEMVQHDPADRPSIEEAFERFEQLRASLSQRTLRSRVVYEDELCLGRLYRGCRHTLRTLFWIVTGTPALPTPRDATS